MVFVKTLRRKTKMGIMSYLYWAENKKKDGKVKIKLLRRLTDVETYDYTEILSANLNKEEKKWSLNALYSGVREGRDNKPDSRDTSLPFNGRDQAILNTIKQWMNDIEDGKLPNKPTQRPKAFIKNVLRPLIEDN